VGHVAPFFLRLSYPHPEHLHPDLLPPLSVEEEEKVFFFLDTNRFDLFIQFLDTNRFDLSYVT